MPVPNENENASNCGKTTCTCELLFEVYAQENENRECTGKTSATIGILPPRGYSTIVRVMRVRTAIIFGQINVERARKALNAQLLRIVRGMKVE